jgi:hypothetical protein
LGFIFLTIERTRWVGRLSEVKRARGEISILQNPRPLSPSPDLSSAANPDWHLRLGIRALAAMEGGGAGAGGAEGELTAQETALYDRQIRVWGVDAQKRCAAARDLPRLCLFLFVPPLLLLLFRFY